MVNKKRGADFKPSKRTKKRCATAYRKAKLRTGQNKSSPTLLRARELCGAHCALAGLEGFEHLV